jgi:hypothetical protein
MMIWMLLPVIFRAEGAPRALILLMMRVVGSGPAMNKRFRRILKDHCENAIRKNAYFDFKLGSPSDEGKGRERE